MLLAPKNNFYETVYFIQPLLMNYRCLLTNIIIYQITDSLSFRTTVALHSYDGAMVLFISARTPQYGKPQGYYTVVH